VIDPSFIPAIIAEDTAAVSAEDSVWVLVADAAAGGAPAPVSGDALAVYSRGDQRMKDGRRAHARALLTGSKQ